MLVEIKEDAVWSKDYAVDMYKQVKELEGYVLWKAKQCLVFGDLEEFLSTVNVSERKLNRKVEYFEAQKTLSIRTETSEHLNETEAIDVITDESNPVNNIAESTYGELRGDTPEEKVEFYEDVKEHTGKDKPSQTDIRKFKKLSFSGGQEPLTEKEAILQTNEEFGCDYFEACSGGLNDSLGVFNIGFEIHKFDEDWSDIKKVLLKAIHSDTSGGDDKAMKFVSMLNMIFRDKKKDAKHNQLKKDMTDRIVELMGINKEEEDDNT